MTATLPPPPDIPGYAYGGEAMPGGFSVVYRFREESPERDVAIKVLKDVGLSAAVLRQRQDEANAMARLSDHPNIVQVLRTGVTADGRHYIVMPYYPGRSLAELMREGELDLRKIVRVGVQIADAVGAVHRADLVHRDIKPANILIDAYGRPRLTDFGVAGQLTPGADDALALSLPWSPPEVVDGGPGGTASDVYSLGATLWNLIVGRSPFEVPGDGSRDALERRVRNMAAARTGRDGVPEALEVLLAGTLAKDPARRPSSAASVAKRLEDIERALGGPAPADRPWHSGPVSRRPGRTDIEDTSERPGDPGRRPPNPEPTRIKKPKTMAAQDTEWRTVVKQSRSDASATASVSSPVRTRGDWRVWATAAAVLAVIATVGTIAAVHRGASSAPATTGPDGGNQDAGALGNDEPPGIPTVTARRVSPTDLRFTWTYSAPLDSDTFRWRSADATKTGVAKKATLDLPDPAGTRLCVEVKVIRADGSYATLNWSLEGCGK